MYTRYRIFLNFAYPQNSLTLWCWTQYTFPNNNCWCRSKLATSEWRYIAEDITYVCLVWVCFHNFPDIYIYICVCVCVCVIFILGKCVISGFRRDVDMICAFLGYYVTWNGNFLLAFRCNLSVFSSRIKKSKNLYVIKELPFYAAQYPRRTQIRQKSLFLACPVYNSELKYESKSVLINCEI
jgi:hypothetical protein